MTIIKTDNIPKQGGREFVRSSIRNHLLKDGDSIVFEGFTTEMKKQDVNQAFKLMAEAEGIPWKITLRMAYKENNDWSRKLIGVKCWRIDHIISSRETNRLITTHI